MSAKDLLLKDLEHFAESMWRNEEVGEKRFSFFVTLATAVGGGLVALGASDLSAGHPEVVEAAAGWASLVLLVLGVLTYLRMLQRNRVTDAYKSTLDYIRNLLVQEDGKLSGYQVPVRSGRGIWRWLKGGYAETVGVINGMLLAATLVLLVSAASWVAAVAGVALASALWAIATIRKKGPARISSAQTFRASVGALIVNEAGRVLSLERADHPGAWQLPQGGLERGEEPRQAILREVEEETGLPQTAVEVVAQHPDLLAYELPPVVRSAKTGRGQVQYWFLLRFRGRHEQIQLPAGGEFRACKWESLDKIIGEAADFRKPVYRRLRELLSAV